MDSIGSLLGWVAGVVIVVAYVLLYGGDDAGEDINR